MATPQPRRRADSNEIRDRRRFIERLLELLPPTVVKQTAKLVAGPNNTKTLRGDRGENLAVFHDANLAQYTLDAADHLRVLSDYIGAMQEGAWQAREDSRRRDQLLSELRVELMAADSLGVHTKDGQRRVREAIKALDETRNSYRH